MSDQPKLIFSDESEKLILEDLSAKLIFTDESNNLAFEDLQPKLIFADESKKLIFDITIEEPSNNVFPFTFPFNFS